MIEPETRAEKILVDGISTTTIARDQIRAWVTQAQTRVKRRTIVVALVISLAFLACGYGLWQSLDDQARQVRRLVDKRPSNAMVVLEEVTGQLCDTSPAEYFVRQLMRRQSGHAVSASPAPSL